MTLEEIQNGDLTMYRLQGKKNRGWVSDICPDLSEKRANKQCPKLIHQKNRCILFKYMEVTLGKTNKPNCLEVIAFEE